MTNTIINPSFTPATDAAYYMLNNLYLNVESGKQKMSLRIRLELENLLNWAYPASEESMRNWWFKEFGRLPGWLDF
jgi:hypothetical protein